MICKKWMYLLLLPTLIIVQSCHGGHSAKDAGNKKDSSVALTATPAFVVYKEKLDGSLKLPGELIAFQEVNIYAKINSFVKDVLVDVGSQVKDGQLLATTEAPEINAQLLAAESKLKSLEAIYIASDAAYNRLLKTSRTPGTISPNDLDIALAKQKSDYAQWQAAKASYREILDTKKYLTIQAPFSGMITLRNVNPGSYVGPSGKGSDLPMFVLQDRNKLRLVVLIPEQFSRYLSQGSKINFTVKAYPDIIFHATINRLAGALDTKLRSQRIEMDVYNTDKKLLPGMIADVNIPLNTKDSNLVVPKTAVLYATTGTFVLCVHQNKVNWVPVQLGNENNSKIEIFGNILPGDTLLQNANEEIRAGSSLHQFLITKL
ncbi:MULTISPECIES: efflux RND transporter periplasmic adaptor subunit [unclassified Hydrotalea]|uniref:efflux RND transporter periplasmic adaptor subunit n=1 Tax=unclassified Hydrotalea TaxID=2643788 RepID=UPI0010271AEF|nr:MULTISPECIES: efflux RND transporter periplasmic adaptor subunit [unclassified Hydrotalea]RWZ86920.1 MAG: efflux RND transporter periplasmic adaptor subunit [Hydrotalea sp. AMD]